MVGLADDIARSMSASPPRVAVVPGRNAIGIELPNQRRETVYLRDLLAREDFEKTKHRLAMALGKTIGGEPFIVDLARMPHLLIAGTTGSGKSVAHQHDDPVAPLPPAARAVPLHHGRSEDAGAVGL